MIAIVMVKVTFRPQKRICVRYWEKRADFGKAAEIGNARRHAKLCKCEDNLYTIFPFIRIRVPGDKFKVNDQGLDVDELWGSYPKYVFCPDFV